MYGEPMIVVPPYSVRERPVLSRSRSHTDPSKRESHADEPGAAEPKAHASRPPHVRSKSYLSPVEAKSENKQRSAHATSALEKTASRLHLTGSLHRHHHKEKDHSSSSHRHSHSHTHVSLHNDESTHSLPFRRHRPTQSEAHPPRRFASKDSLSSLPHLVAGLNAERERRTQQGDKQNHGSSAARSGGGSIFLHSHANAFGPPTALSNDYQPGGRYDAKSPEGYPELRRRATSDPASRDRLQPPLRPKNSLDEALDRGDAARVARRIHVKKPDILRRDREIEIGEEELRSKVAEITAAGAEITRRLDYGYYNLLEKVGNLVSMIGSFQSLAKQSGALITNFDRENDRISQDTMRRIETFRQGFEARQAKAEKLAERGERVSAKATELSTRLEAARVRVQEWDRREEKFRKAWDRVWGICWWTTISVVVLVASIIISKEWYFQGDPVKAGLQQHAYGHWNKSLRLGGGGEAERMVLGGEAVATELGRQPSVPEDVKQVLAGIAERNRERKQVFSMAPPRVCKSYSELTGQDPQHEDSRLKKLDEL
jgi:hypothetical protein